MTNQYHLITKQMNNRQESFGSDNDLLEFTNAQNRGISIYGLSSEDVHAPNFGLHTMVCMDFLRSNGRVRNDQEAFDSLRGLDNIQSIGICIYLLSREDVGSPNFGEYTLMAMQVLRFHPRIENNQEAFEVVRGLDYEQTRGIIDYGLNRTQVMNPAFSEATLNVMRALHLRNLHANGSDLYNTAIYMLLEHQFRGVNEYQLTLEQIGISVVDGNFEQDELVNPRFRANHVDAMEYFMETENMEPKEAYQVALCLNSTQISGMINFGLRLDQVQHPFFCNDPEILGKLIEQLFIDVGADEWDFNIPLNLEQQEKIRIIFDSRLTWADVDLSTKKTQTDIQDTDYELLRYRMETIGIASMPVPDDQQNNEAEELGFYIGSSSDESLEDRKPAAKERKKPKTQLAVEENIEQGGQNLQVPNTNEFLTEIRGASQVSGNQEATVNQEGGSQQAAGIAEGLRGILQLPIPDVSGSSATHSVANSGNAKTSKKRKRKPKT